jgi:hypothetical protein
MVKSPQAYQEWLKTVVKKMPHLSKSPARGLAMWSFAIAITGSCRLSTVTSMGDLASVDLPQPNLSTNRSGSSHPLSAPTRLLSCFRRGGLILLASLILGLPLPLGSLIPDFFPATG